MTTTMTMTTTTTDDTSRLLPAASPWALYRAEAIARRAVRVTMDRHAQRCAAPVATAADAAVAYAALAGVLAAATDAAAANVAAEPAVALLARIAAEVAAASA